MIKHCTICGAEFSAPPSSKKITCSPECSRKQKSISHTGLHTVWSEKALTVHREKMRKRGYTEHSRAALEKANSMPEGQRGPQNRGAKIWVLIDPYGNRITVVNLTHWARENAHLFDRVITDADRDRVANNISSGFANIIKSWQGKLKRPVYTYKGWGLACLPEPKRK